MKLPLSIPKAFIKDLDKILPQNQHEVFLESLHTEPIVSVRLNTAKKTTLSFPIVQPVTWCKEGFYLAERPSFTDDPSFWAGAYYVQEASSMFLEQVIKEIVPTPSKSLKVLDLSAAPGGKSTHLAALLPQGSLLVCNEVIRARAGILQENMARWGASGYVVTQTDPETIGKLTDFFDIILIDAPCSGEGMFRKEAQASSEWSEENVFLCAARQKHILADILPALKPNGYLIYSTCTYNTSENEENLAWITKNQDFASVRIPLQAGIVESSQQDIFAYRFFPHLVRGEGFFMACLQKKHSTPQQHKPKKNLFVPLQSQKASLLGEFAPSTPLYTYQNKIMSLSEFEAQGISYLASVCYIRYTSLYVGEFKQNDFIPSHELAMSQQLPATAPKIALDYHQAMQYLRKQALYIDSIPLKSWNVVTYNGLSLGIVKVLPNRINNYYPSELRVRKF